MNAKPMTVPAKQRRRRALARLENQLIRDDEARKHGENRLLLSTGDLSRIKKEIDVLKTRI